MHEQGWGLDHFTDIWHFVVNGRCLCRPSYHWGSVVKREVHESGNCAECTKILARLQDNTSL